MKQLLLIGLILLLVAFVPGGSSPRGIRVGSKQFTESDILGEMLSQMIRSAGEEATPLSVGGTTVVYGALKRGEVDLYPEYTGTLIKEVFSNHPEASQENLEALLAEDEICISQPLGFNNSYALAVRRATAEQLNLVSIEDLAAHPDLRLGFSNEFVDRDDGWKNLRKRYGLTHQEVAGMEHSVAYRQLEAEAIDVMDVYTTDAQLAKLDLVLLTDNLQYFPRYDAVVLYRSDLKSRFPGLVEKVSLLEMAIEPDEMIELNARVASREVSESQAAADFLRENLAIETHVEDLSVATQIWRNTLEHCDLVRKSLIPAIFVAIPLGIFAAKFPRVGQLILGAVGVVQTIPALALLVLLIAPVAYFKFSTLGAGSMTAIVALFLYSLLPIVRNTTTGLSTIAPEYLESAAALGLSSKFRLLHIELPLASPSILAGIKTAGVLNVGFATLGALVGAQGYGQPILRGVRLNDTGLIMQGAIPAACLAILLQVFFELAERWIVPASLQPLASGDADVSTN